MPKVIITLDEIQVQILEQALLDKDMEVILEILTQIREKIRSVKMTQCGIENLRKY